MKLPSSQRSWIYPTAVGVVSIAFAVSINVVIPSASAVWFGNPTAPSPGGNSAIYLDTSKNPQQKLGSLIIGDQSQELYKTSPSLNKAYLCLNAKKNTTNTIRDSSYQETDYQNCIQSWSDLPKIYGEKLVHVFQDNLSDKDGDGNLDYEVDLGYVRLVGSTLGQTAATYTTEASNGGSSVPVGLLAYDNLGDENVTPELNEWAGRFFGRVIVGDTSDSSNQIIPGLLCLNSTYYEPSHRLTNPPTPVFDVAHNGYGCIHQWSDLGTATAAGPYVHLRNIIPMPTDDGLAIVSQSASLGALVAGTPPKCENLSCRTCGDGLCSDGEVTNCAVDCRAINAPTALLAADDGGKTKLTVAPNFSGVSEATIVIFRSTSALFSYDPIDGVSYVKGQVFINPENIQVVFAQNVSASAGQFITFDSPLPPGTYTYRAYQGNAYPRYNQTYKQANVMLDSPGGGEGGEGDDKNKGGGGCFIAGTSVSTPNGSVPIERVKVGDRVYSFDEQTGQTVIRSVAATMVHSDQPYGRVTLANGTTLDVTSVHRFYLPEEKIWKPIGELKVGDVLLVGLGAKAHQVAISALTLDQHVGTVYNFEVEGTHNYYVRDVLVHNIKNANPPPP